MSERITEVSPRVQARIAGFLYLIVIVGGIFAELFVRGRLVVHGDAAATAHNIVTHELLFRSGFAVELFYCAFCNIPIVLMTFLGVCAVLLGQSQQEKRQSRPEHCRVLDTHPVWPEDGQQPG